MAPARNFAQLFRQSVQAPIRVPWKLPGIIGPVTRWTMGLFAEMPPISWAGVVLSQPGQISTAVRQASQKLNGKLPAACLALKGSPPIKTTASTGWPWIISSVSMLIKFLRYMLVGDANDSWRLMVGKSIARPPFSCTPRFTASMSCGMLAWHGLKLEYVFTIPMMGRDSASLAVSQGFDEYLSELPVIFPLEQ